MPAPSDDPFTKLSQREIQVLRLIAVGKSNKEVAALLGVSANTVAVHRTNIMGTLGVHKATELVLIAVKKGLVQPGVMRPHAGAGRHAAAVRRRRLARVARPRSGCGWWTSPSAWACASRTTPARSGRSTCPETLGAGAAFLDIDGDGWQDLLLVNGTDWPGQKGAGRARRRACSATTGVAATPT